MTDHDGVEPQDIKHLLIQKFSGINVEIIDKGTYTLRNTSGKKYDIKTELFGIQVYFRLSSSLTFVVDEAPVEVMEYVTLGTKKTELKEIEHWLNNISHYLRKTEIPAVKHIAMHYLGRPKKVRRNKRRLSIHYDKFFIFIGPVLACMYTKHNKRIIHKRKLDNDNDLETFFKEAKTRVDYIEQGRL